MSSNSFRLLVPISSSDKDGPLLRFAASLAATRDGSLDLAHIHSPDHPATEDIKGFMDQAINSLDPSSVQAQSHCRPADNATEGIQSLANELGSNMLVMGWDRQPTEETTRDTSNSAGAKNSGLDTLVFLERGGPDLKRIIVPTSGGSHSLMGLQLGYELAQNRQIPLEVIRIARAPQSESDSPLFRRFCSQIYEDTLLQMQLLGVEAPLTIIPSTELARPIIERCRPGDLVILGASNGWQNANSLAGGLPDEIARHIEGSVLLVRSGDEKDYRLSQIFWERTVRLNVEAADKWEAITRFVDVLVEERQISPAQRQTVLQAALEREEKSSTAMGHATAIPHAPITGLPGIIGALGISQQGIEFGSSGEKAHFIFLLLTPQQNYRVYIPVLAQIAGLMRASDKADRLKASQTPQEVIDLLKDST